MFGYSNEKESYKSRLSFSDAIVKNQSVTENGVKKVILSEPKPTSYMDYLNQDKYQNAITYNTRGFQLRGVKQYWLHQSAGENIELNDKEKMCIRDRYYCALKLIRNRINHASEAKMTEDEQKAAELLKNRHRLSVEVESKNIKRLISDGLKAHIEVN